MYGPSSARYQFAKLGIAPEVKSQLGDNPVSIELWPEPLQILH
jgi:hypothetical protein